MADINTSLGDNLWYTLVSYEMYLLKEGLKDKGIGPDDLRVLVVLRWLISGKVSRAFRPYELDYRTFFCRQTLANGLKTAKAKGLLEGADPYAPANGLSRGQYRWTDAGENFLRTVFQSLDRRLDRYRGRLNGYEMSPYKRPRHRRSTRATRCE